MKTTITFRVAQFPSGNVLRKGRDFHARTRRYKKLRNDFHLELLAGPRDWREWPPDRVRKVKITRFAKTPRMDDDNLAAGAKPLRDALHLIGATLDDREPYAVFDYDELPGPKGTTVEVELSADVCTPTPTLLARWESRLGIRT